MAYPLPRNYPFRNHTYWAWDDHIRSDRTYNAQVYLNKGVVPKQTVSLFSLSPMVRWDLVVVFNQKGDYDMSGKVIPKPTVEHYDWMAAMAINPNKVNLRDYRDHGGPDARIWLMDGARRITEGMKSGAMFAEMEVIDGQNVNAFAMTDNAKKWWENGKKQKMTNKEIFEGWEAFQSMSEDIKGDKE